MSEKFKGEKGSTPENLEDQIYKELQVAIDEERHIMDEIEKVLTDTSSREEAEKIILEKYATLMDNAIKKSGEALKAWLKKIEESREQELKELDEIEKD